MSNPSEQENSLLKKSNQLNHKFLFNCLGLAVSDFGRLLALDDGGEFRDDHRKRRALAVVDGAAVVDDVDEGGGNLPRVLREDMAVFSDGVGVDRLRQNVEHQHAIRIHVACKRVRRVDGGNFGRHREVLALVAVDGVRDEVGALVADPLGTDDISQFTINAIVRVNRKHIDRTSRQVAVDNERLFEIIHRFCDVLTEFVLQTPVQSRFLFVFFQITFERPIRCIFENQRFGVGNTIHKRGNLWASNGLVQFGLFCK